MLSFFLCYILFPCFWIISPFTLIPKPFALSAVRIILIITVEAYPFLIKEGSLDLIFQLNVLNELKVRTMPWVPQSNAEVLKEKYARALNNSKFFPY